MVKLEFDPRVISYATLVQHAKAHDCATSAFPLSDAQAVAAKAVYGDQVTRTDGQIRVVKDTKYYLRNTPMKYVPMTRAQATLANADVKRALERGVLSPSQVALLKFIEQHPKAGWKDVVDQDLVKAWDAVEKTRRAAAAKSETQSSVRSPR